MTQYSLLSSVLHAGAQSHSKFQCSVCSVVQDRFTCFCLYHLCLFYLVHHGSRHLCAGSARVKDCLEQHRQDDGFSSECREEIETMMQERATDFRLDSSLRDACEEDIMYTCGWDDVSLFTPLFVFLLLLRTQRRA